MNMEGIWIVLEIKLCVHIESAFIHIKWKKTYHVEYPPDKRKNITQVYEQCKDINIFSDEPFGKTIKVFTPATSSNINPAHSTNLESSTYLEIKPKAS